MSQKSPANAKKVLAFYWQHVSKYKLSLFFIVFTIPVARLFNDLLPPLILAGVLKRLSTGDYIAGDPWQSFSTEIITYAALVLTAGIVVWRIIDIAVWKLEGRMQRDIARHVFSHLISQSADFHANHFGGSLVSKSNKLLVGYVRIADTTFFGTLPLIVSVVAASVILSTRAPLFSASLVIFTLLYVVASFKVSLPVRRAGAKHATIESKQTGYLADAVSNAMAIKSFASDEFENKGFAKATERTRQHLRLLMKTHQRQMIYFTSMTSTITAGSLILAIISVVNFDADIATVFLIFNYTATIIGQLFQFSNQALRNYNRAIGDASDMVAILGQTPEITDPAEPQAVAMNRGSILFNDVTFAHKDAGDAIFSNLNLRIKPGEKVGLVGHSGSGKSTLTRLLLRFSDVQGGSIEIDGQNIAAVTQNDLRRAIAYVPQEPLLFHRTIGENIGYSDPDASMEQIRAVAKQANAAEFIDKLPLGYETLVGERGIKLSGGQRQRVAIARAMLKNAPILVLDEATSALDSESEELIQQALWKLMEGRTAIVIAHRLSTIQKMDRILVMNDGKIVEEGTHKELAHQGGVYANLWQKQSGGFLEE